MFQPIKQAKNISSNIHIKCQRKYKISNKMLKDFLKINLFIYDLKFDFIGVDKKKFSIKILY